MTDHIYGRGESLVSKERPHMFCQEVELYVNYYEKLVRTMGNTPAEINYLKVFKENLENGIQLILGISEGTAYPDENLKSIPESLMIQWNRLKELGKETTELQLAVNF
jgi:hypothetical protein